MPRKLTLHDKPMKPETLERLRKGAMTAMTGSGKAFGVGGFRPQQPSDNPALDKMLVGTGYLKLNVPVPSARSVRKRVAKADFLAKIKAEGNPSRAWKRPPAA